MSRSEANEYWKKNYSKDFYKWWDESVKKERGQIAVQKMKWFITVFNYQAMFLVPPVVDLPVPKQFNYNSVYNGETVAKNVTRQTVKSWLEYHESEGGHTIANHVGRTDEDLIARLSSSPRISGSSTFLDLSTAETVISSTIRNNRPLIDSWLKSGSSRNLVLSYNGSSTIGRGIMRGQNSVSNLTNANVVLKSSGNGGYNILTAFPK